MLSAAVHGRCRLCAECFAAPLAASLKVAPAEASARRSFRSPCSLRLIPLPKYLFAFSTAEPEALVILAHDADPVSALLTLELSERNAFFRFFFSVVLIAAPFVVRAPLTLRRAEAFPRGGIRGERLSAIFTVPHCATAISRVYAAAHTSVSG